MYVLGDSRRFRISREKRVLASCPSVRMHQHGSYWTDYLEIWYWKLIWKSVEKIQFWLKSDKNFGHFTWIPKYVFTILKRTHCCVSIATLSVCLLLTATYVCRQYKGNVATIQQYDKRIVAANSAADILYCWLWYIAQYTRHCRVSMAVVVMRTCHSFTLYVYIAYPVKRAIVVVFIV